MFNVIYSKIPHLLWCTGETTFREARAHIALMTPLHQTLHFTFYSRNTSCFRFFTLSKYGHDRSIIPFHLKHLHSRLSQEVRENTYPKLQRKPGSQIKIWSNTFHQYFSPRLRTNPLVRLKQFTPRETRLCATGKKQEETKQYKWQRTGTCSPRAADKEKNPKAGLIWK